jgi:hypothetical protein
MTYPMVRPNWPQLRLLPPGKVVAKAQSPPPPQPTGALVSVLVYNDHLTDINVLQNQHCRRSHFHHQTTDDSNLN